MLTKICKTCGEEKGLECFGTAKTCKDGYRGECKACISENRREYYEDNREKKAAYDKNYREANFEKVVANRKKYYEDNCEKIIANNKNWREANLEKDATYHNNYVRNRRNNNPEFKLLHNLRKRLWDAVKGYTKSASTMELIGCTIENLQKHLENQFTNGMNWENYGEWHVDHIIPCASFDLSKEENQRECFNYTNLQPLWAEDNLRKSNRILSYVKQLRQKDGEGE